MALHGGPLSTLSETHHGNQNSSEAPSAESSSRVLLSITLRLQVASGLFLTPHFQQTKSNPLPKVSLTMVLKVLPTTHEANCIKIIWGEERELVKTVYPKVPPSPTQPEFPRMGLGLLQFNKLSGDYYLQSDFRTTVLRQIRSTEKTMGGWNGQLDGETEWCCFDQANASLTTSPSSPQEPSVRPIS